MHNWDAGKLDLVALQRLAQVLAVYIGRGDLILLEGDLGTGKTTFARALIAALAQEPALEVPSPTFSLVQSYESPRGAVHHFDLYRLGGAADVREIGFEDAQANGLALVEWPDRAAGLLPDDKLRIVLSDAKDPEQRNMQLIGEGAWAGRLQHVQTAHDFIAASGWSDAQIEHLAGDASRRIYARLTRSTGTCLLMDSPPLPDGPPVKDGKPYWVLARSARDIGAFIAVDSALRSFGFSAPAIHAQNLDAGLLLIEDLGDLDFAAAMRSGHSMRKLYGAAVELLADLANRPVPERMPIRGGREHRLPVFDLEPLQVEVRLLLDWYWPQVTGAMPSEFLQSEFEEHWRRLLQPLMQVPRSWVLRDVHSPNLIWLPERDGLQRVGLIDFQDALAGHSAYDLAALLQDARLDVPEAIETELFEHYLTIRRNQDATFDATAFRSAYAVFAAQRATKLLGIFVRLARRDGKPNYLSHLPRIHRYLHHSLRHDALAGLRAWYGQHLPG